MVIISQANFRYFPEKGPRMKKTGICMAMTIVFFSMLLQAEPNGAVLYRKGIRLSHCNVPATAEHHYFGYLEGPAWENKFSTFRYYIDKDDRNIIDVIGKYKEEAILQHFSDSTVDEHSNWPWGTDIFKINSSMGLGPFRLYLNNNWLNPQIPENLDSLVATILDSSVQTPKIQIGYYGWNIGNGAKVTALWTIATTLNERPTHCELTIIGNYSGKVVVGLTNHKDNTSNPNGPKIQLIQDSTRALLATLGKQGGLSEGFDDTLLLAVFAPQPYFDSFVKQTTVNYGMVLKPDADNKVKWSIAYSWAREANPLFRQSNWKDLLAPTVSVCQHEKGMRNFKPLMGPKGFPTGKRVFFTLSGRLLASPSFEEFATDKKPAHVYILRNGDGTGTKITGED
jgi:hypothetical protein